MSSYRVSLFYYLDDQPTEKEWDRLMNGFNSVEWVGSGVGIGTGKRDIGYTTKSIRTIQRLTRTLKKYPNIFIEAVQKINQKKDQFDTIWLINSKQVSKNLNQEEQNLRNILSIL